jgi:oxygen-dependent protoporphyrinogen oxidase
MQVIVVGGGISGLACAYRLKGLGLDVLLLEKSVAPGGVAQSIQHQGFQFDLGPQSFLSNAAALSLVQELGLAGQMVQANPRAPRFVRLGSQLHRVPMSPPALLSTPLLSAGTKLRLLSEPLRKSVPPAEDESVADFARRKFGVDLLDNLLAPFVSGVYAGDPEKLSFRSAFPSAHQWEAQFGSVIRGAMKSRPPKGTPRPVLTSFRGGLSTLMQALAAALGPAFRAGAAVEGITRGGGGPDANLTVRFSASGKSETGMAQAVVVASPSDTAADILEGLAPGASALRRIAYAPVAVVNLGYRREQVRHSLDGFGFLVPRTQKMRVLGTIWGSSLFPGRAPEGMVSLTSFLGGATDPGLLGLSDEQIFAMAGEENARILGIQGKPVVALVERHPRAIPQYNLGHGEILGQARDAVAAVPGLFLAGNYLHGPAVGTCIETALATAQQVAAFLSPDAAERSQTVTP